MIYVYIYSDSPDGISSTLRLVENAITIEEAKEIFAQEQKLQCEEYCGDDINQQFLYFAEKSETNYDDIVFLKVSETSTLNMEHLRFELASELKDQLDKKNEEAERKEYERLRLKYKD
jgi:hypothetical protein